MRFLPVVPIFIIYIASLTLIVFLIYALFNKIYRHVRVFRRIAIIALILLSLARPVATGGMSERLLSNLNILFVIDNTGSMAAKDIENGTKYRYEKVAEDIDRIADLFPGAKYGAVALDYNVRQAMPMVGDINTIKSFSGALKPKDSSTTSDSELSELLSYAKDRIESYEKSFPERKTLIFFMSDGEDTSEHSTTVPETLKKLVSGGAVIGYGSTAGSKINKIEGGVIKETQYVKENGQPHISTLDEENLKQAAKSMGIKYYRRSSSEEKMDDIKSFADISSLYSGSEGKLDGYTDLYWVSMLLALALLLWDFSTILDTLLLERRAAQ